MPQALRHQDYLNTLAVDKQLLSSSWTAELQLATIWPLWHGVDVAPGHRQTDRSAAAMESCFSRSRA